MTTQELLERLGPFPTYTEVGEFLGSNHTRVWWLVEQGKLEAIQTTTGKKRVVLNSLLEYLNKQQSEDVIIARQLESGRLWRTQNEGRFLKSSQAHRSAKPGRISGQERN